MIEHTFSASLANQPPEHLLYILSLQSSAHLPVLQIELVMSRVLKSGGYSKSRSYHYSPLIPDQTLTPDDQRLCKLLDNIRRQYEVAEAGNYYKLRGSKGAELLPEIINTGRCFWASAQGQALNLSEVREAHFSWQLAEGGNQRLQCRVAGANLIILPLIPLWYVDLPNKCCGPITTDFDPNIAIALLNAPALKPEQIKKFYHELQTRGLASKTLLPTALKKIYKTSYEPTPMLTLFGLITKENSAADASEIKLPLATLSFAYEKRTIHYSEIDTEISYIEDDSLIVIQRNKNFEEVICSQLRDTGIQPLAANTHYKALLDGNDNGYFLIAEPDNKQEQLNFMLHKLPQLEAAGWQIIVNETFPLRIAHHSEDWYSEIEENAQHHWFGFELGIVIDGNRINMLPLLLKLIQQYINHYGVTTLDEIPSGTQLLVQLPDGRYLPVAVERIRGILGVLTELYDGDSLYGNEKLRLSRLRITQLLELGDVMGVANLHWLGGENLRRLGEKLRRFTGIKSVTLPDNFGTQLRQYQQEGLNWLQFLREYELAGILADDMGLGKTVQALAHLLVEKASGRMDKPCLVVAPTSLMFNWCMEAQRFTPDLKVLGLHGNLRKKNFSKIPSVDIVLTTYPLLVRDYQELVKYDYHLLILDEAQIIKNNKTKTTQVVQQLHARHRLCLTGTPLENHLGELWSLFNFLLPGLLGSSSEFKRLFRAPIEKHNDAERRISLIKRIAPFMLRRIKQEVIKELPEKTEIICNVELEGAQLDLYESIRVAMHHKVMEVISDKGIGRSHIIVLDALLKLRQVCCDPRLLKLQAAAKIQQSAKLNLLMDMLPNLIEEGRKILLFSSFASMLDLIEDELQKYKISYEKLTGQTKDRAGPIQRFQQGKTPIFLISLKAGGIGLNLTAADTVIHYDPWWNPAAERQATDRAHRIGQDKAVFVYKLVTAKTVEEKIVAMQAKKQALLDSLFSEQADTKMQLTVKDLDYLFEPLC